MLKKAFCIQRTTIRLVYSTAGHAAYMQLCFINLNLQHHLPARSSGPAGMCSRLRSTGQRRPPRRCCSRCRRMCSTGCPGRHGPHTAAAAGRQGRQHARIHRHCINSASSSHEWMPLLSLDMLLYQLSSALASLESIIFFCQTAAAAAMRSKLCTNKVSCAAVDLRHR
jgi:hypothetical protein